MKNKVNTLCTTEMASCPYLVYHHTVGLPDYTDWVDEELTDILAEIWEALNGNITDAQANSYVNEWSELGDEKERRLYLWIIH